MHSTVRLFHMKRNSNANAEINIYFLFIISQYIRILRRNGLSYTSVSCIWFSYRIHRNVPTTTERKKLNYKMQWTIKLQYSIELQYTYNVQAAIICARCLHPDKNTQHIGLLPSANRVYGLEHNVIIVAA